MVIRLAVNGNRAERGSLDFQSNLLRSLVCLALEYAALASVNSGFLAQHLCYHVSIRGAAGSKNRRGFLQRAKNRWNGVFDRTHDQAIEHRERSSQADANAPASRLACASC